jgi:hypothetical protein
MGCFGEMCGLYQPPGLLPFKRRIPHLGAPTKGRAKTSFDRQNFFQTDKQSTPGLQPNLNSGEHHDSHLHQLAHRP